MAEQEQNLEMELASIRGELARLTEEKASLISELRSRENIIAELKQSLADKDSELVIVKQAIADSEKKLTDATAVLVQAVASYRALLIATNPEVPSELISGDTVDALDQSLEKARALVSKVRQGVEAELAKLRVPFSAPLRTEPDLSALSAREKIQYAIGGKK